ncbi:glutathione S-transferase family protein [Sulfitobacter sp. PR48]|uniref:glutathione S-transferase family protein n=1 Tax=Sulfitobacter sp. PR48 TaxID=3028383 RepID=UPI00237B4A12|nr:glutathione S-transferase family protein [Sulfitobacter sp. PR48]MDD9723687.1 glutathione S-transferase family protein [Sulfitobacter sp. PR48]
MNRYVLHYAPDNASLIVRLALDHMGRPFETRLVNRATGEQGSPAYRGLNPHGLIPVLETPQGPIFETGAILLWLADTHGGMAPAPDHPDRAAFLKWLFFVSNTLHPALRMTFYPEKYAGPDPAHQAALRQTMQMALASHLAQLDRLAASGPAWLDPQTPGILHFYLACCLRWCALYPLAADRSWFRLAQTAHLHNLCLMLETLPCTRAAQAAEGLGPTPFTAPQLATPPEGSAT